MDYNSLSDDELLQLYQEKMGATPDFDSMSDDELLAAYAEKDRKSVV